MTAPGNASTALARTVLDQLVHGGVEHVVLAPGSRSAPLAFAAHAAPVTLHTRIDERSAGFLALGIARTARRPVAVVTTSGTATANLHPAVLEAHHAGIPLVVLTADRPASLRGTNANQTTNQVRLYGDAAPVFHDVPPGRPGPGEDERAQVAAWRTLVRDALARGGPVHLNLQLGEPLTPGHDDGWRTEIGAPAGSAPQEPGSLEEPAWDDRRTVVVAGDDAGSRARMLAEQHGWPLLAEPSSGARTGEHAIRTYRLLLGDELLSSRIERVVVCGHPTLSRPVMRLISRRDIEVVGVPGPHGVTDPGRVIRWVVEPGPTSDLPRIGSPWLDEWLVRDADVGARLDAFLDAQEGLLPHHVAAAVAAALPERGLLFVGASNPIRDLDLMVPRYRVGGRRMVVANRGLAGIDGSVSSAVGAAIGRPHSSRALALLGDVTFLHDSNGLLVGPGEVRPDITIVVVNDDGGSIFASLEQGAPEYAASFEKLFGTPHAVDLAAVCAAHRVPHRRVRTREALQDALDSPSGGVEVVEAVVPRDNRRELDAAIRELART